MSLRIKQLKKRTFSQVIRDGFSQLWEDIKSAKWAIMIIIAYFAFFRYILYSLCPMVLLTGYPCPGCGLTRAGTLLLCFRFREAFEIHPFIYPIVLLLVVCFWNRYIRLKKAPEYLKWCTVLLFAAMVGYFIWRMYHFFPGQPPMSYYSDNLFARLRQMH